MLKTQKILFIIYTSIAGIGAGVAVRGIRCSHCSSRRCTLMSNRALTFKAHPLQQVQRVPHEGLVANRQHWFGGVVCQISHTRTSTSRHQHCLELHDVCWGRLRGRDKQIARVILTK